MTEIVLPLVVVACGLLGVCVVAALDRQRWRVGERVRVDRVVQSAEWRLQRLGQAALAEMLDALRSSDQSVATAGDGESGGDADAE